MLISISLLAVVAIQALGPMVDVGGISGVISPLVMVFGFLTVLAGSFLAIESFR